MTQGQERIRYHLLDSIRGLTVTSMVLFHLSWDLVYLYNVNWPWFHSYGSYVWQQSICWTFILVSGFCWSMGKRKWKRGLVVFGWGAVITVVTLVIMPEQQIVFGVLTLLGSCMLLQILLEPVWKHLHPMVGLIAAILLFALTKTVNSGVCRIGDFVLFSWPDKLYANYFTTYFGFPHPSFYSTDYFSLLPWYFLFLSGYFMYRLFEKRRWLFLLQKPDVKPLSWVGRHAMEIYVAHQPVVYGILMLLYL